MVSSWWWVVVRRFAYLCMLCFGILYIVYCFCMYVCIGTVYMRVSGSYLGSMYMYMYMSENYSWWEESEMK